MGLLDLKAEDPRQNSWYANSSTMMEAAETRGGVWLAEAGPKTGIRARPAVRPGRWLEAFAERAAA